MSIQKIDPTLLRRIERLEQSGGATERISVIVQCTDSAGASETLQQRLAAMGATNIEPLKLASAIVAELSPARVREIAGDAVVKRVVSNEPQKVEL